ncbi:uncharacterized protein CTRU02_207359 [Colletotrichum truncatum]|uniref:Uncharacterized protein n=1 Tax=Colletotrichum truncatum TaxID=5467 RepID=A0ACC3Z0K6_COLTU
MQTTKIVEPGNARDKGYEPTRDNSRRTFFWDKDRFEVTDDDNYAKRVFFSNPQPPFAAKAQTAPFLYNRPVCARPNPLGNQGGSTVKSVRFADRTVVDLTKEPQPIRVLDGMYQSLDRVDAGGFNPGDALVAMQFLKEQQPNAVEDLTKMIKATKIADTPEKWAASLLEGSNDVNSPSPIHIL